LDLKELGYEGSYDRVAAFARQWKAGQLEWVNSASKRTVWVHEEWLPDSKSWNKYRILPKRLAEPHSQIVGFLEKLGSE
jgi:hypothetical protein